MATPLVKQLATHIRELYVGKNWTWSNIKENLQDVSWIQANHKIEDLNTIVGLTYHINYYIASIVSVLNGGPLVGKDKYSFDHPKIESEKDWKAFLEDVFQEAEELASLVEQMEEATLWTTFGEEKYGNHYRNIAGFIEHSHYHLGQIVMLKKLLPKHI